MDEIFKKLPQLRFRGQAPAMHYKTIKYVDLFQKSIKKVHPMVPKTL